MRDTVNHDLIGYYPETVFLIVAETIALGFEIDPSGPVVLKAEVYPLLKYQPSLPFSVGSRDHPSDVGQIIVLLIDKAPETCRTLTIIHDEYMPASAVYSVHIQADTVLLHYKDLRSEFHDLVEFFICQFIKMFYQDIHMPFMIPHPAQIVVINPNAGFAASVMKTARAYKTTTIIT